MRLSSVELSADARRNAPDFLLATVAFSRISIQRLGNPQLPGCRGLPSFPVSRLKAGSTEVRH